MTPRYVRGAEVDRSRQRPAATPIGPADEGADGMIEEVLCPHCDRPTVVDLPDATASVEAVHRSLRYSSRESCRQCEREFSVRFE